MAIFSTKSGGYKGHTAGTNTPFKIHLDRRMGRKGFEGHGSNVAGGTGIDWASWLG